MRFACSLRRRACLLWSVPRRRSRTPPQTGRAAAAGRSGQGGARGAARRPSRRRSRIRSACARSRRRRSRRPSARSSTRRCSRERASPTCASTRRATCSARSAAAQPRPHLVFSAHLDTVFPEGTNVDGEARRHDAARPGHRRRLPRPGGASRRRARDGQGQHADARARSPSSAPSAKKGSAICAA